jgi:hypothetical protein
LARLKIALGQTIGKGRSKSPGMASLVNMYVEEVPGEGRTNSVCYPTPGKTLFASIGGGVLPRGQITASGVHYAVVRDRLYSVTAAGATNNLGEIEGVAPVDMAYDGRQIGIVTELKSYEYATAAQLLSEISDPSFEQASTVGAVAGYMVYGVKNTGRFRWKLATDATFNPLDFATAEAESDAITAIRAVGGELAMLGRSSLEWWRATGQANENAFARSAVAAAPVGSDSRDTAIVVDGGLTFVGRDGLAGGTSVYRTEGHQPQKISSPHEDEYLETAANIDDLHALAYQQRGHLFYCLTDPNEFTLAWDIATKQWAHRKSGSWSMGDEPTGGWDARTFTLNGDKQIVGCADGNLYQLDLDTLSDLGGTVISEATSAQLHHDGRRAFMPRLELDIEAGVGLPSGLGSAPVVYESHSDDGGKTWTSPRAAGMGAIGQNKWRAVWNVLGSYRQRVIKIRVADPVPRVLMNLIADINVGTH